MAKTKPRARPPRAPKPARPSPPKTLTARRNVDVREVLDRSMHRLRVGTSGLIGTERCTICGGFFPVEPGRDHTWTVCRTCVLRNDDEMGDVRGAREIRKSLGLSQTQMGEALGIGRKTVGKIETGVPVEHARLISLALRAIQIGHPKREEKKTR
jgi:DNA-binding XRE family transcriptional regulator